MRRVAPQIFPLLLLLGGCQATDKSASMTATGGGPTATSGPSTVWDSRLMADLGEGEAKKRRLNAKVGDCVPNAYPADAELSGRSFRLESRKEEKEGGKKRVRDSWIPCTVSTPASGAEK